MYAMIPSVVEHIILSPTTTDIGGNIGEYTYMLRAYALPAAAWAQSA